jgi:hypothetical protein
MSNVNIPSNKSFGVFLSVIFLIFSLLSYFNDLSSYYLLFFFLSLIILFITIIFPKVLGPFNFIWMKFGIYLGKIMNPIILSFIYFFIISPLAIILNLLGRDELRLKPKKVATYWVIRKEKNIDKNFFEDQF